MVLSGSSRRQNPVADKPLVRHPLHRRRSRWSRGDFLESLTKTVVLVVTGLLVCYVIAKVFMTSFGS
jgi:hypothetical protein